jgi:hypothetical protein
MLDQKVTGICPTGAVASRIEAIRTRLCELRSRRCAAEDRAREVAELPQSASPRRIKIAPKGRPLPGTFASGWKHRMDGGWERRPS